MCQANYTAAWLQFKSREDAELAQELLSSQPDCNAPIDFYDDDGSTFKACLVIHSHERWPAVVEEAIRVWARGVCKDAGLEVPW